MSGAQMSGRSSGRVEGKETKDLLGGTDKAISSNDVLAHQHPPQRVRPERAEAVIAALTHREQAIVGDVGRLRVITGGQLQRLHFEASASGQRHGRRILTSLTERRVLARLGRSIGGVRAGSAGFVYSLDVVGQRLNIPGSDVRRPWLPSAGFVRHAVMVSECYVQLRESAAAGRLELLDFEAEPGCWRSFVNRRGGHQTLKPDAFVRVGLGEFEDRWFLECDRATEDLPRIVHKTKVYGHYWQTGKEAVFPRVLWVANRAGRAIAIARVLEEVPDSQRRLFAVCEMSHFTATVAGGAGDEEELTNENQKGGAT